MLWRLHIRSAPTEGKNHKDVVDYCIENQVAGIGWPVDTKPQSTEEYEHMARTKYGSKPASVNFTSHPQPGDLIWSRDPVGLYYLGKVEGEWYYDDSPEVLQLDIPNQRKCSWILIGNEEKVPGKVISCFRPSRAFQAIHDEDIETFSVWLYHQNGNGQESMLPKISKESFYRLIDYQDTEDLVGIYLQYAKGYVLIPSSCKRDTIGYEYLLKHKDTGKTAVVQVKQGWTGLDDSLEKVAEQVYLFTSQGIATSSSDKVQVIQPDELFLFCQDHLHLLPKKMLYWMEYVS